MAPAPPARNCSAPIVAVPEALGTSALNTIMKRAYERAGLKAEFRIVPNRRGTLDSFNAEMDALLVSAKDAPAGRHLVALRVPVAYVTYFIAVRSLTAADISTIADLNRYRVAYPSGFSHIAEILNNATSIEVGTYDAMLRLLKHDRIDAAVGSASFAAQIRQTEPSINILAAPIEPRFAYHMMRQECGAAIAAVEEALGRMVRSGEVLAIYTEFGIPETAVTPEMLTALPTPGAAGDRRDLSPRPSEDR